MIIIGWLSDVCLLLGGILVLTGAVGLLRLPDFFTRLHAASVTETLGAVLLIIGIMLDTGLTLDTAKLILLICVMFIANPTITHGLCRAAAHGGIKPAMETKSPMQNSTPSDSKNIYENQIQTEAGVSGKEPK
jgi:multicomponent Na+:H+ antiporter subunit G